MPGTPELLHAMNHAITTLKSLGCRVDDTTLPPLQEYNAVGRVIISAEAYALHEATLHTRIVRLLPHLSHPGAAGRPGPRVRLHRRATPPHRPDRPHWRRLSSAFDVLLSTPTAGAAPILTDQRPDDGFARPLLTTLANVAAVPSLVVCAGWTVGGLPLGVEIIGPAWGDATVLRLGHQFEQAAGTRDRRPEL